MKLFWKILAVYFLAWALLTVTVFAVLTLDLRTEFIPRSPISQNLPAAVGVQIAAANFRVGDELSFAQLAQIWKRGEPPYVVGPDGRELLGRSFDPATLELARSLAKDTTEPTPIRRVQSKDGSEYVIFYPDGLGPEDRSPLRWLFRWPWLIAVFFATVGLLLAAGLSAAWTRPISALERSFDGFAEGDLELELGPEMKNRRDEIGDLARHFEKMARRLASSVAGQKRLLHDISHELRSPLARLTVAVELARRRPGETGAALDRIERECQKLDRMIHQVLTLARLEEEAAGARAEAEAEEYFDLLELLRAIHDDVAFEAEAIGLEVELIVPGGTGDRGRDEIVMRGRAELLHRAVENVVRNALKHAVEARRIEIRLEEPSADSSSADSESRLRLRIGDDGRAQPDHNLGALFDAFTHGKSSDGFGLGLAIAKRAVAVHGGEIRAAHRPGGGLEVVIDLPAPELG